MLLKRVFAPLFRDYMSITTLQDNERNWSNCIIRNRVCPQSIFNWLEKHHFLCFVDLMIVDNNLNKDFSFSVIWYQRLNCEFTTLWSEQHMTEAIVLCTFHQYSSNGNSIYQNYNDIPFFSRQKKHHLIQSYERNCILSDFFVPPSAFNHLCNFFSPMETVVISLSIIRLTFAISWEWKENLTCSNVTFLL